MKHSAAFWCSLELRRAVRQSACAALCALLAACAGGGSTVADPASSMRATTNGTRSTAAAARNVTFTIGIPPKPTGSTSPKYISPSTQSMRIFVDGAGGVTVNPTPFSPNCSPNPNVPGGTVCRVSLQTPAGNHVFTITAYDALNATGSVLSTNTTGSVYVKPVGVTTIAVVLEGSVRSVYLALANTSPPFGQPSDIAFTALLEDADGNIIVGPAGYRYPVTLTTSDAANAPLSKTLLVTPANTTGIIVRYDGARVSRVAFSATATGLSSANVHGAILTPGAAPRRLYVANTDSSTGAGSINVYDLTNPTSPPTIISGSGLSSPKGLMSDPSGKLYVANGDDTIRIIDTAHANAFLPPIRGGGLLGPVGLAIDSAGRLYAANEINDSNSVSVFDTQHGNAPLGRITGGGLASPSFETIDSAGRLYVANGGAGISVFDTLHGDAPIRVIPNQAHSFAGLAIDGPGKLYAGYNAGPAPHSSIDVIDTSHGDASIATISGNGLDFPKGPALDENGRLYAANSGFTGGGIVSVFDTLDANAALPPLTAPLSFAEGVAVH